MMIKQGFIRKFWICRLSLSGLSNINDFLNKIIKNKNIYFDEDLSIELISKQIKLNPLF